MKQTHWWRSVLWLAAMLASSQALAAGDPDFEVWSEHTTEYTAADDLLTAGLGLEGLRSPPPGFEQPHSPSAAELRRLAMHSAWNALALLGPAGGLGDDGVFRDLAPVAGHEVSALLRLPGAAHPFRVLVQIPARPATSPACLLVAPASGSRGVYGAVPLAGPTALSRGCAIAYTDKGAGTDFHTLDDDRTPTLSGVRVANESDPAPFRVEGEAAPGALAMKHAHSGDHPEADWGRHVLAAARFGQQQLRARLAPDTELQILAVGLSNGAAAVLRAAEIDHAGLLNAVVAVMPNITGPGVAPLYDYATLAALLQPCALGDGERTLAKPLGSPLLVALGEQRCASLVDAGVLDAAAPEAARGLLLDAGFDGPALRLGAGNVALDLWRAVAGSYASAYLRRGPDDMPCGYGLRATAAEEAQRAAWWASHSGVGPGGGIELIDTLATEAGGDSALPGLLCLRELWTGESEESVALRTAVEQTRATAQLADIPVLLIHGREDGLIPAALSSRPYVASARAGGAQRLAYWEIDRAQHFDAFLNVPGVADRLVPILPYGWVGIDHLFEVLAEQAELGPDRRFAPVPGSAALSRERMGLD